MPAPQTLDELRQTAFYKAGADARKQRKSLAKAIACLRPGCWQYDAFIAGYDGIGKKERKQ